eukprot:scaffold78008_cov19-Tisochrysis_lutea.AAC.4
MLVEFLNDLACETASCMRCCARAVSKGNAARMACTNDRTAGGVLHGVEASTAVAGMLATCCCWISAGVPGMLDCCDGDGCECWRGHSCKSTEPWCGSSCAPPSAAPAAHVRGAAGMEEGCVLWPAARGVMSDSLPCILLSHEPLAVATMPCCLLSHEPLAIITAPCRLLQAGEHCAQAGGGGGMAGVLLQERLQPC